MKIIRLIMVVPAMLATVAATSGFALLHRDAGAPAADPQQVNWGEVTIPGTLCKVSGPIRLHDGEATVSHSGYGIPVDVYTTLITHGDLGRNLQVTTLQIFCATTGGTAASQISEGIFVFDSPGGTAHLLGTLTPTYFPASAPHIPYLTVDHIDAQGHIATTELWYKPGNGDADPTGRAYTIWKWTGHGFIPGHTTIAG